MSTTTIGYYPGCSLKGTANDYELSARKCAELLGIDLKEIPDWNCCGASSAHCLNHDLSLALPARNMALATENNLTEIFAPCSMCFASLRKINHHVKDKAEREHIENIIERKLDTPIDALSMLDLVKRYGMEKLAAADNPLKGMKLACYYGCLLVRPAEVAGCERPEAPTVFEEIIRATGAEAIEWNFKSECCGGGLAISRADAIAELVARLLEDAEKHGAEALVTACPMCMANLDMRQKEASELRGRKLQMPVYYLSEIVSLALGLPLKQLKINTHITEAGAYIKKHLPVQRSRP
jgi:heterodisulfide reductase subunit B